MRKIVLTFGLIAGAIMSAMLFLALPFQEQLSGERGAVLGYTSMVLASLMTYYGVRAYRDTIVGGAIGFGRAFTVGLLIAAVSIACYVVSWEIIYYNFTPDFAEKYAAQAVEKLRQSGATEAAIAAKTKEMADFQAMYRNPLINIAFTILEPLPVALLASLLSAWLVSRRRTSVASVATA